MHYTKEWTIEVREDIFNQLREENYFLTQENVELRNKLELAIRTISKLAEWNKNLKEELSKLKDIQSWKVVCLWWFGV